MVRITENLIRKRAEHNECEISTLEEVSLHQQDIERIEYIDKWCRELKILYLQSNLIPKIENVSRLKKLEYLNLALNNVEKVENLEGCESLQKLDLTVNFVGELTSIECLRDLPHFNELFLTGNPCTEYEGYRQYVIATLPHLKYLDGTEVEKSERIVSKQEYEQTRKTILEEQEKHRKKREKEKQEAEEAEERERLKKENKSKTGFDGRWYTDINEGDRPPADGDQDKENNSESDKNKEFWEEKAGYTPESRIKVHQHMQEQRQREQGTKDETEPKKERTLITDDGRVLNVNDAKIDFTITDDEEHNQYVLDVAVFKHMDTSLLDTDVQPTYVRVTVKGKILQLRLDEEVNSDSSKAQRSTTTGHLVITMPKAKPLVKAPIHRTEMRNPINTNSCKELKKNIGPSHEKLEVDPNKSTGPDFGNIVKDKSPSVPLGNIKRANKTQERSNSEGFVDDPDVPPLE